jgi:hypothetical protein
LENVDHYVIWCSDDRDRLVRENERVVTFPSVAELRTYALQHGLQLKPTEVAMYDWDSIERWCDEPAATGIVPGPFLDAWNMIVDALPTSGESSLFSHADGRNAALYDKLFRANNLPAMTPPGAEYYPVWTKPDVGALAQVLRLGLAELRHQLAGGRAV